MASKRFIFSERDMLAAYLGDSDVMPRPPRTISGQWNAHAQTDHILSLVIDALETNSLLLSTSDAAAAFKFNRSALGYSLTRPSKQNIILAATQILVSEAGLNPADVSIQKQHDRDPAAFKPAMYVVLPTEDAAHQLERHVVSLALQKA